MRKRAVIVGSLLGGGVLAVCIPDARAYHRLARITRGMREAQRIDAQPGYRQFELAGAYG